MIKFKKEKKTKEERAEEKRLKKEQKLEKKAGKKEKKPKTPKSKKPSKPAKPAKAQKTPKAKKPKLTKAEKAQIKKDKLIVKTKRKAEKIRAKAARKSEKIQIKTAAKAEKKQLKKELKAENKQFEKDLKQEIKEAKKDMPKSKMHLIIIPLIIVAVLAASAVFLHIRGIGPFGSFKLPEPPGFLKTISSTVSSLHPIEKIKTINPLKSVGSGGAKDAEKAVVNLFDSLIALDFESAEEYIDISALKIPDGYISIIDKETLMNATFDKLEYEITAKADKTGESEFEVAVSITAVNIKHLMAELVKGYTQFELDAIKAGTIPGQTENDKKIEELLGEFTADPDIGTLTTKTNIKVNRENKSCYIIPDEDLTNALFGGVISAAGDFFSPDPLPEETAAAEESGESESHE